MESQKIQTALVSLDMAKTNINGAIAALNQNKTFSADVSYSIEAIDGAVKFLFTVIEDLKDFSQGAKNTEQQVQPDNAYRCTLSPPCSKWSPNGCCSDTFCINKALQVN